MGEFQSGQMGQTVNLLRIASVVRIHPLPPEFANDIDKSGSKPDVSMGWRILFCIRERWINFAVGWIQTPFILEVGEDKKGCVVLTQPPFLH